jgi:hypothetical protein
MALGSAQPVTEMSTRNFTAVVARRLKHDNLSAICEPIVSQNVRAWTSRNPKGPLGLLQG